MNKRLIWNFELKSDTPLQYNQIAASDKEDSLRWEIRFFWPHDQIITLSGLSDDFLDLSRYKIKSNEDIYYFLPNASYNIKKRRGELVYKPLIKTTNEAIAFGKKIILNNQNQDPLPSTPNLNAKTLISHINEHGQAINVAKERLIYRFPTTPKVKLELAKITIEENTYFSLSIESRALSLVKSFQQQLLSRQISCDYISFLKSHCRS